MRREDLEAIASALTFLGWYHWDYCHDRHVGCGARRDRLESELRLAIDGLVERANALH